jgi:hypothetical protein
MERVIKGPYAWRRGIESQVRAEWSGIEPCSYCIKAQQLQVVGCKGLQPGVAPHTMNIVCEVLVGERCEKPRIFRDRTPHLRGYETVRPSHGISYYLFLPLV